MPSAPLPTPGSAALLHHLRSALAAAVPGATVETVEAHDQFVKMNGSEVFKFAVRVIPRATPEALAAAGHSIDDLTWLVPHQANLRIIDAVANRMGLPKEKVMINIQKYGNTTSATIPLCLWEWENKLHKGDNIILAAFGGGFTWGSVFLKWAYDPK